MTAYYNEHDPFAAEWLRRLILFGHIAPGDVDERDIRDVSPDDLRGYEQHHFFAGIGVWSYALRRAGWSTPTCPVNTNGHQAGNNRYVTSVTSVTKTLDYAIRGRLTVTGEMEIGCCVETLTESQSGAPLNPAHSRRLMGLPPEWDSCGGMATPSTRKSRRASSKP